MFKEIKTNNISGGGDWAASGTSRPVIKSPRTLLLPEHLDGEQLEEMIAAAPLDLSVFSVQSKPARNAESPLDLSLKTRKRTADSTDENHIQLCVFPGSKRVCQGVTGAPELVDRSLAFQQGVPGYVDATGGNKGDLYKRHSSSDFDGKPSVIKIGYPLDKISTPSSIQEQYNYYQQKQHQQQQQQQQQQQLQHQQQLQQQQQHQQQQQQQLQHQQQHQQQLQHQQQHQQQLQQQQQHHHQQHLQQLKSRQHAIHPPQPDLSPQQLLSQKHQMVQQRKQMGQQVQLSQQQQHQQHQQHHQHQQHQQMLSKHHQLSPQQQFTKQQQALASQQQQQQQTMKHQMPPQQQLSHQQQKFKQQQQHHQPQQQHQHHGFQPLPQYIKHEQQHKSVSHTTPQDHNSLYQQELKHRQQQLQKQQQQMQRQQSQQRHTRDDIAQERYMQTKPSEKTSPPLPGYASHRQRNLDVTADQHLHGYPSYENSRAANSSQNIDTGKHCYTKQTEPHGSSHNQTYTVKHSSTDGSGFSSELQRGSQEKQTNVTYSTNAGHQAGYTCLSVTSASHSGGIVHAGPAAPPGYQSGRNNAPGPSTNLQYYNMSGGTMSRRHSPHCEGIQRCSPDSTISTNSPKQFHGEPESYSDRAKQHRAMMATDPSRRLEQSSGFSSHQTPTTHTFTEPHSPAGNGQVYSRESSPGMLSRGSPSSYRGHSPSALRQHPPHSKTGSRGSSPSGGRSMYLSHSLSPLVHSAMSSPVIPMSRAVERSIIKGTSGVCKAPSNDNQCIHSNSNVCDSKLGNKPPHRPVTDHMITSAGVITKPSDPVDPVVCIKQETFSVPKEVPVHRTSFNSDKILQSDIKTEKENKVKTEVTNGHDVRKPEEAEIDRYACPLTIAIPGSASTTSVSVSQSSQATVKEVPPPEPVVVVKAPRPYSKKQIIMNAVNNDECLKKIVNTVSTPRPKPYASSDHLNQSGIQDPSPAFPESPKMPTLSPQQKLSPAIAPPLTGEPPTLEPPDASSQRMRLDQGSKISMIRRFSVGGLNDKLDSRSEENHGDGENRPGRPDHAIMGGNSFSKWTSGYSKNIPVANVSPMVHGNNTSQPKQKSESAESYDRPKYENESGKSDNRKPSSVAETFGDIKYDERFLDDDIVVLDKEDMSNFPRSRNIFKSLHRQKQLSEEKTDECKTEGSLSDCVEDSLRERKSSLSRSVSADKSRSSSADHSRSSSADKARSSSADRPRSLLAEIANSDGYVAETKVKVKTDDLLTDDPANLGREERALLRAIKRFEEMEERTDQPPASPKATKQSNTKLKADEIRRKARGNRQRMSRTDRLLGRQKWIGRRKRKKKIAKPKGFIDFKPKVLEPRTRTQAAGKKPTYDRNAAYDRELSREECRKALKRRERLRQTARRICRRMSEKQEKLAQERRLSSGEAVTGLGASTSGENGGNDSGNPGMWEVGDTSSALRQTLRNGKSKGGLMMTLLFKPKHLRFGRRHSPRRGGYQLRTNTMRKDNNARSKRLELGSKLEGARRRGQAARRKLNDQRRRHSLEQQEQHCSSMDNGPLPLSDGNFEDPTFGAKTELSNDAYPLPVEVKKLAVCRDTGETILHRAARMGHTEIALHCVQSGRVDVNVRDNAGYTPLHESCVSGNKSIAHLLLSRGANVNCSSQDGIRPIHDAVENDNVELVRMLLAFGADPTLSTYGGKTPQTIARTDQMKLLLHGHLGDLNGFTDDQDRTVWCCTAFGADKKTFPGVFTNIPADPQEEDQADYIFESRDPEFSTFKLSKSDNKTMSSGDHVLLNDVTDFLQLRPEDVQNDSNVKSLVTNVSKTRLAATSYGQTHPERVSCLPGTSGKAILSRDLKDVFDICSKRKEAAKSALAQSNFPHKFKHYKLQRGYDSRPDTPSTSGNSRGETKKYQVGATKCNFEEVGSKSTILSSRGCKTNISTTSSECASVSASVSDSVSANVSDSVYDFDDDFADVVDNFTMRIGAVPEDFRVFNGHPNVTDSTKHNFDSDS